MATSKTTRSKVIQGSKRPNLEADGGQSFMKGDLGFGLGLKPGSVECGGYVDPSTCKILSVSKDEVDLSSETSHNITRRHSAPEPDIGERQHKHNEQGLRKDETTSTSTNGTGFLSGLRTLMLRTALKNILSDNGGSGDRVNGQWLSKQENELFTQLESATQEVNILQSELEAARRQLDSKYRAIKILQSQALMINKESSRSVQQAEDIKKSLEHEVNSLQFDLSTTKDSAMLSQQTWAERFNRVCLENESILATLRARSEQVHRMQVEKNALMRERDELLALMDAKERLQYEHHKSATHDAYLHNSLSEQFAVLGACLCRGSKPEPCGCARAAARLKKENDLLKDKVIELKQNLEGLTLKADSYLTAFDNQLDQNYLLAGEIRRIYQEEKRSWGRNRSKHRRKKDELQHDWHWFTESEQSTGENEVDDSQIDVKYRSVAVQVSEPLPDLITTLADMLSDKTEALAHQRLVAKMLARKTQDLEKTMERLNEYSKH